MDSALNGVAPGQVSESVRHDDAIGSCTARIENVGNMQAFYWRAKVCDASRQTERALQDYRRVADSEDPFRSYAAIAISVIYAGRNDMLGMLKALNAYGYL